MNKLKSIFLYGYSIIAYLLVFFLVWGFSYIFLFPSVYSFMVKSFGTEKYGNEQTVIVSVDDKSIMEVAWPWNRNLFGKIISYFEEYTEAKSFGLDIYFRDTEDEQYFYDALKKYNDKLVVGFIPSKAQYENKNNGEILEKNFKEKYAVNIVDKRLSEKKNYLEYSSLMVPQKICNSVNYMGSAKNLNLYNGPLAKMLSLVEVNGNLYPSLALRMYMLENASESLSLYEKGLHVDKTDLIIPFADGSNFSTFIKYYKFYPNSTYSHKQYSAIDIVNSYDNLKKGLPPVINPNEFKGKTVFLGMNAVEFSDISDVSMTPLSSVHPGVDIQATIFDNLINSEFVHRPAFKAELAATLLLSLFVFFVVLHFNFSTAIFVSLGIVLGYLCVCAFILYPKSIAPDVISPLMVSFATLIFGYAFKFIKENKTKEKVKNAMGKYISKDVMQNVVNNIDNVKLGGRKANVTVLFADIRGFTSMSEKMTAEEVSVILNEYFSAIEPIITNYNGVINKFIGDAVMAIFGDPIEDEMHPMNAVLCANDMLKRVAKLRNKWSMENKPEIEIGIGINTGEVFVGNIGSETRLEYTVIGDTVNIASRIESYNKVYKTKFLIGSSTYESVKNRVDVIKIGGVTIRGKQKKMDIYEILRVNKPE